MELWLNSLALAPKTRSHLRALIYQIWDYARMWSGAVPVQVNPISLVTVKGCSKRLRQPRNLNYQEFHNLVGHLKEPFRTMAIVCVCLGLRVSEMLALRWRDIDWLGGKLNVERGIVNQVVDDVKTDNSKKFMTGCSGVVGCLTSWKQSTEFPEQ